jgi:hypothetical protein
MTRDWVLTLLVLSLPFFLAATMMGLALIGRKIGRRLGHTAEAAGGTMGAQRLPLAPADAAPGHEMQHA